MITLLIFVLFLVYSLNADDSGLNETEIALVAERCEGVSNLR